MEIFFALQCEGLFICIPITLHSRRFSLCINKEHTMQYAIAGWPVAGCPSESL
ncbi:protease FtsH-inhibitory lysogeny factor CIII, partial [Escherichia coli]|nr:protease FtsH-inhibitory lysogeny factor CIII [Escherichia coli]